MKKALVVGIDDYSFGPLRGCVNDAERVASLLKGKSCDFVVRVLKGSIATRASLRKEIQWLLQDADASVLFFAGHGLRTPIATYLATYDAEPDDEGIDLQFLATAANRLAKPDQTVIYLLDCCHSGDATPRGDTFSFEPMGGSDVQSILGTGRVMLAACKGSEAALEYDFNGKAHGAFTHHLCVALEGAAANAAGQVTLNAAYDYVATQLRESARQTPVMKGDQEGAIVLATGVTKTGSWSVLSAAKLTAQEASEKAEEMLSRTHLSFAQNASLEAWKTVDFASACRAFEPVLTWFRRRVELQPELLRDSRFKQYNDSCSHFLARLCSLSEGTHLPNGRIGARVGSGSFGTVWRISEGMWSEPVCFKSFHPHDLGDKEKVNRFRRGYEAMKQLDHPNIVKVLQINELPFGFFMQYVDGPNLRALNPGASADPDKIVQMLIGISETLKHAHGRGVIHRDVKPENILIKIDDAGDFDPYLTDFDLAWFSSATQITQVAGFGSHYYAAPEQMDSPQAALTHAATVDAYSFGQLCFYAVCGRDPLAFNHDGNVRAFGEELSRKWNDSDASQEMLSLFADCTNFKPRDRVQDFRAISERLAKIQLFLTSTDELYDGRKFLEQLRFNLGSDLKAAPVAPPVTSMRSRSGRTEITLSLTKDSEQTCGLDVTFRPNDLMMEGHNSSSARTVVNQRIDAMLQQFSRDHSAERRGAKSGAFEITVRIDHLSKKRLGVLKAREIVSRTIDLLEQL